MSTFKMELYVASIRSSFLCMKTHTHGDSDPGGEVNSANRVANHFWPSKHQIVKDAAWYYPDAKSGAKNIEGYVAFYKSKVQVA